MKKLLTKIAWMFVMNIVILSLLGGFLFFFPGVWGPPVRNFMAKKISQALGGPAQIVSMRIKSVWPLILSTQEIHFEGPALRLVVDIEELEIGFAIERSGAIRGQFNVHGAKVALSTSAKVQAAWQLARAEAQKKIQTEGPSLRDWAEEISARLKKEFEFKVQGLDFRLEDPRLPFAVDLKGINSSGLIPASGPIEAHFEGILNLPAEFLGLRVPIRAKLPSVEWMGDDIKVAQGKIVVFGLEFLVDGVQSADPSKTQFKLKVPEADLAKLPEVPGFLPPGKWRGPIAAEVEYSTAGGRTNIQSFVRLPLAHGDLDYRHGEVVAAGPLKTSASAKILMREELSVPDFEAKADATHLALAFSSWLNKAAGVPCSVSIQGAYSDDMFQLGPSHAELAQIKIQAEGRMTSGLESGGIQLTMAPARLEGIEKIFPPLEKQPMSGAISGRAFVSMANEPSESPSARKFNPSHATVPRGDRVKDSLSVELSRLQLDRVRTHVRWPLVGQPVLLSGPVEASGEIVGRFRSGEMGPFRWLGLVDLTQVKINQPGFFKKPERWPLQIRGGLSKKKDSIEFLGFEARLPAGKISLSGSLGMQKPMPLNLVLAGQAIDLGQLFSVTEFKPESLQASGRMDFNLATRGNWDAALAARSPVAITGGVKAQLKELEFGGSQAAKASAAELEVKEPSQKRRQIPLLPELPMIRQSRMSLELSSVAARVMGFNAGAFAFSGAMNKGLLSGKASFGQIFGGRMSLPSVSLGLVAPHAPMRVEMHARGIRLRQILAWLKPELARGADAQLDMDAKMTGELMDLPEDISSLSGELKFKARQGEMDSHWLLGRMTERLRQKGIPVQRPTAAKLRYVTEGEGRVGQGVLTINQWVLETSQGDQMVVRGTIKINLEADLSGTMYLARAGVGGAIADANRDDRGRLVLPFVWKGLITEPDLSIAESTLNELLRKTAQREAQKFFKEKVEGELKKGIDQQLKKLLGQ